jgi:hypothetical protein
LKLGSIGGEIERMALSLQVKERESYLDAARALLSDIDPAELTQRITSRERPFPWLVGVPLNTLADTFTAPDPPGEFMVLAADGSSIPRDRHSPIPFYVLNTGHALLCYGPEPSAELDSESRLFFEDTDLYIAPGEKDIPIEGTRLGIAMSVAEMKHLLECCAHVQPSLAIIDGSLILWALQSEQQAVQDFFLMDVRNCLAGFQYSGVPIASYVSYPGSYDVCNSLRYHICRDNPVECRVCSLEDLDQKGLCRWLGRARDRELFCHLQPGERSDVFASTSAILPKYGRDNTVDFFYMNVGGEIARIELPRWASSSRTTLDTVHAIVFDQCRRSGDEPAYPPALQEAHEQAIISTTDRRLVEQLVEQAFARQGMAYTRSAKDRSKRRRGV